MNLPLRNKNFDQSWIRKLGSLSPSACSASSGTSQRCPEEMPLIVRKWNCVGLLQRQRWLLRLRLWPRKVQGPSLPNSPRKARRPCRRKILLDQQPQNRLFPSN